MRTLNEVSLEAAVGETQIAPVVQHGSENRERNAGFEPATFVLANRAVRARDATRVSGQVIPVRRSRSPVVLGSGTGPKPVDLPNAAFLAA